MSIKPVDTPVRPGRGSMALVFSLIIAIAIQLGATTPFTGTKWLTNASILNIGLALFIPMLVMVVTGPLWAHDVKKRLLSQLILGTSAIITCYYVMFDCLQHSELAGLPPVMQFGLYWVYVQYPVVINLAILLALMMVASPDAFKNSIEKQAGGKNIVLVNAAFLIIPAWVITWTFLNAGFAWSLLIEVIMLSVQTSFKVVQFARTVNEGNATGLHAERTVAMRNGRNGTLHVVKAALAFMSTMLMLYYNVSLLNQIIVRPIYLPTWLQFFPIFLGCALAWGFAYRCGVGRFWMVIASMGILMVNTLLLISRADGFLAYDLTTLVLSGFSISGFLLGGLLYTRHMATGRFSQVAWTAIGTFFIAGGMVLALVDDAGLYCTRCLLSAGIAAIIGLIVYASGFIMSRFKGFWNKGKRELLVRVMQSLEKENDRGIAMQAGSKGRLRAVHVVLVAAVISSLAIVASGAVTYTIARSTEQVLGTHEGDFYLWVAGSTRNVDSRYLPNLPGSPVDDTVRLSAARGEHEGVQIVFTPWGVKNLNVWSITPGSALKHVVTNETIGAGNISIYNVEYVPQLSDQYPDRLPPFQRVDTGISFTGQKNWPFYIDVYIPENVSTSNQVDPGVYRTTITFTCIDYHENLPGELRQYNTRVVSFQLEVDVFNVTMTAERHVGTEIIWNIPENAKWRDFYTDHRLDWYFGENPVVAANATTGNVSIQFDWNRYFSVLDPLMKRGMEFFPVSWTGLPGLTWGSLAPNASEQLVFSWYLTNMSAYLSNHTTPWGTSYLDHAYFFIIDEPGEPMYPKVIQMAKLIHQHAPQMRIMETMNNDLDTYNSTFLEEVDIYCQHVGRWVPSENLPADGTANGWPQRIREFLATYNGTREKVLWVYHTHNGFPRPDTDIYMSGIMQRNSFWMHWIYNATGWLYWSFNWGMDMSGGYGYAGFGESTLVGYGPGDVPISSLRLERVRDGIEDFEYFWMLDDACKRLEGAGRASEALAGRVLLQRVDALFNKPEQWQHLPVIATNDIQWYTTSYEPNAAPYLQLRGEIGAEIGLLQSIGLP